MSSPPSFPSFPSFPSSLSPRPRRQPSAASAASASASASTSSQHIERVCDTIPVPQNLVFRAHAHDSSLFVFHPHPQRLQRPQRPQMRPTAPQNMSQSYPMDIDTASTHPIPRSPEYRLNPHPPSVASPRKLCIHHQRTADEGTTITVQQVSSSSSLLAVPTSVAHRTVPSHSLEPRCPPTRRTRSRQQYLVHFLLCFSSHS